MRGPIQGVLMATNSESVPDIEAGAKQQEILVWDAPLRVVHWLMVLTFAGAYLSAESERWQVVHATLGYTMAGLIAFRLLWGLIGTRHARFAAFVRGPSSVRRYLGSLLRGRPEHHAGHNPAGAWAIVAMIALAVVVVATGWTLGPDPEKEGLLSELHESAAAVMLGLVCIHVAAVVASSWLHRENLVRAMINGRKSGHAQQAIRTPWRSVAGLVLVAVLGFWWLQWDRIPALASSEGHRAVAGADGVDDDD
jgi:cytochrome b